MWSLPCTVLVATVGAGHQPRSPAVSGRTWSFGSAPPPFGSLRLVIEDWITSTTLCWGHYGDSRVRCPLLSPPPLSTSGVWLVIAGCSLPHGCFTFTQISFPGCVD
ncbi:hypothetical protein CALCODRAFT_78965 [Calocera cornea HHB12733]|uniref:Uncharacterized protein n=1 Tax=Calocera cornea HHB12733 TaxID=1353952 RepID=A0A165DG96_9BASI|nr:hypothetical protein CALCODRAFT_78965 [Calocera cornea HHB12733]